MRYLSMGVYYNIFNCQIISSYNALFKTTIIIVDV